MSETPDLIARLREVRANAKTSYAYVTWDDCQLAAAELKRLTTAQAEHDADLDHVMQKRDEAETKLEEALAALATAEQERDAYRSVLVGAGYESLDTLPSRGIAFATTLGEAARQRTLDILAKLTAAERERDEARARVKELEGRP